MNTNLDNKMNELNTEVIAYLKKLMAAIKPMGSCIDKNTAFLNKNKKLKTIPRDLMESYNREIRKALDGMLKETEDLVENIADWNNTSLEP